ncbi:MAG: hypothetical protein IT379_29150, partial [Deltaproteobacteria bacterium]|nr:hypothetical protein [Deltaproteobacteria bacterium]
RTDAFGVAATVLPTDHRVNEGEWRITAEVEGRTAEVRVPVRRYELPKMRVDLTTEGTFALPGDTVRAHLNAAYLFGEPVTDAAVSIDARTANGVFVATLDGRTNAEGRMDFEVTIPESLRSAALEESGDTLLLSARVVDTAAQEERGSGSLILAAAPLRIHLVTESIDAGVESPLWVLVTDPLGRPLRATVEVTTIDQVAETSASGIAELRFVPPAGTLDLEVTATDGAERTHTRRFSLGASGDETRLRIQPDRAFYRAGDVARISVDASADVERVWVDVYRGASGVLSTAVDVRGGRARLELPITDALGGMLVVDAFALTGAGETIRTSRPLVVERDDQLRVTVSADRETFGPGEEARLDVRVEDGAGVPQVASVGLSVVDEAVFRLGGEPTTTIQRAFGLDTSALPPGAQVAGRTADDVLGISDAAEREQLTRVLFASAGNPSAPSFSYNSIAEEMPRVRSSLEQKLRSDTNAHFEELRPMVQSGWITERNIDTLLRGQSWTDPFGRLYRLTVEGEDTWSRMLRVACDGPDELTDTADDVEISVSVGNLLYGYDDALNGGAEFADEDGAGAPRAAGRPEPGAPADPGPAPEPAPPPMAPTGAMEGVRADFRETVLVQPTLVTDTSGAASVVVPLADSITTWRVSAEASSRAGHIGSARHAMRTFQDFFVDFTPPARLRRGDIVEVPAIVYNYLDARADVAVTLEGDDWFVLESGPTQNVSLGPAEVRAVRFRMRVTRAGQQLLSLRATAGSVSDALARTVDVYPDGQPEDESFSGLLESTRSHTVTTPDDAVEGGTSVELVLTPGFAAEAVSGIESMLHEPNGCFEQTTATAWPNTMVANYLEATGQMTTERREEVVALVTRGYQRLLTFESPTGGFNWWGDDDPGNRILSAIMLWHLKDLETVLEPDVAVRDRTLQWLLSQQNADGSWEAGDALHAGNEVLGTSKARTTAFIAWALGHTGWAEPEVERAAGWLRSNVPPEDDLYANALAANALAGVDPRGTSTMDLFARLDRMKIDGAETGTSWASDAPSWTGASGEAGSIETTGLVAYALMRADAFRDNSDGAMRFILANKDSVGTWYNTQATMNALRALSAAVAGTRTESAGTILVSVNGEVTQRIDVDADNRDLYRRFDLGALAGTNEVRLDFEGTGEVSYRVVRRAYRPVLPGAVGPLSLTIEHDTTSTQVGVPVLCTARVTNNDEAGARDQVIVRIGRAPGFNPITEDLEQLVANGLVSRYEVRADDVTLYLMGLAGGETRALSLRMIPALALEATAPASSVYAYYEPSIRQSVDPVSFVVTAANP